MTFFQTEESPLHLSLSLLSTPSPSLLLIPLLFDLAACVLSRGAQGKWLTVQSSAASSGSPASPSGSASWISLKWPTASLSPFSAHFAPGSKCPNKRAFCRSVCEVSGSGPILQISPGPQEGTTPHPSRPPFSHSSKANRGAADNCLAGEPWGFGRPGIALGSTWSPGRVGLVGVGVEGQPITMLGEMVGAETLLLFLMQ